MQYHAHAECKDRDDLVKLCELSQKSPENGDKEQWHKALATWKTGSIRRQTKNEQGQWRNRPLADIKSDAKTAVIRRVKELAESHNTTAGVPPPSSDFGQSSHFGVPPPKDSASSGASSSAQALTGKMQKKKKPSRPTVAGHHPRTVRALLLHQAQMLATQAME